MSHLRLVPDLPPELLPPHSGCAVMCPVCADTTDEEERKISEMVDRRIEADIDMWDDRQPPEDEDV